MKHLDRYLLREGLPPLLFGLVLYSTLAVVSMMLPRMQWVVGVPLLELAWLLLLQFPAAIVQTLPIALLLAVLLAFGRLAASNELLAVQAGGVALRRLALTLLALGLVSAGLAAFLNERVLPQTNARVGSLWWELTTGSSGLFRLARQNVPLGDYTLYFGSTDRATDELHDVRLEAWQGQRLVLLRADRARFVGDGLELFGYRHQVFDYSALDSMTGSEATGPEASDETAEGLLRRLIRVDNRAPGPEQSLTITTSEGYEELITRHSQGGFEDTRSSRHAYQDAHNGNLPAAERLKALVLFHRKLAEPLANLTLLLIAVPLAVLYARSRSVAFGLSLVVTLVWYLFLTIGQLMAQAGAVPVWLGVWSGNIILAFIGLYLLYFKTNLR
jgi:lipopolysaccharide export system permease protein